jgi:hypothetical protein
MAKQVSLREGIKVLYVYVSVIKKSLAVIAVKTAFVKRTS